MRLVIQHGLLTGELSMRTGAADLLESALRLPETERAELAAKLLSSLDSTHDLDARSAWLVEIERRVQELDSGAVTPVPWSELRARIEKRLGGK
jgi:putative addiction module component (TIGR02574 family)